MGSRGVREDGAMRGMREDGATRDARRWGYGGREKMGPRGVHEGEGVKTGHEGVKPRPRGCKDEWREDDNGWKNGLTSRSERMSLKHSQQM